MSNGNTEKDQQGKRMSGFVVVVLLLIIIIIYVYKDKKLD